VNARAWLRGGIFLGAVALGWLLHTVTVPLLAAYLLMLVLRPVHRRLAPRLGPGAAALVCLLVLLILPLILLAPILLETDQFAALLPTGAQAQAVAHQVADHINQLVAALPEQFRETFTVRWEIVQEHLQEIVAWVGTTFGAAAGFLGGLVGIFTFLLLMPVFVFFLLQGAPWLPRIRGELPAEWHPRFDRVLPRIEEILRVYCQARLGVAAAKALLYLGILLLVGIPGAYTLSLLAGVLSLLPVLGPILGFLALGGVAFADQGWAGLGFAGGAYLLGEIIEGYVLLPKMVGRGLGLSDFAVILAALAGGALLGVFGLLIAIPALAVGRVLYDEYLRPVMGTEDVGG